MCILNKLIPQIILLITAHNAPFDFAGHWSFPLWKLPICKLSRGGSSTNCPKFAKVCPFLFTPHARPSFVKYATNNSNGNTINYFLVLNFENRPFLKDLYLCYLNKTFLVKRTP